MRYVVDTSVVVKWLLPEPGSEAAQRLRASDDLCAPDWITVEVAAALWKRVRFGDLPSDRAETLLRFFRSAPVALQSSSDLVVEALAIATNTGSTVYDALYLALAVREDVALITADTRFARAVTASYPGRTTLLSDL
ncbi:MAG TPA: type II toxin-antitoxin system VapC family toxin [Tepidiformaceae bacterium]|nr:type II toxin-antitoxin system VapC family toxin [Tepidiformaceae bacterium]